MLARRSVVVLMLVGACVGAQTGCQRNAPALSSNAPTQTSSSIAASPTPANVVFGQAASPIATPAVLTGTPDIAALVEKVRLSVVNITTRSSQRASSTGIDPFDFFRQFGGGFPPGLAPPQGERPSVQRRAAGTGFIVDRSGYVVTNNHVVEDAEEVSVKLSDDRSFKASVVGRDAKLDVALLKLESASDLPAIVMGDSDALRVGEYVVAIGNPFGLGNTVTMGIVSAKDRSIGAGPYDDFIQTDASINPGNSGGPLFNLRGEVVGINTAIHAQGQGIGFAIPMNLARDSVAQLRATGQVSRGKLGLVFQPLTEELGRAMGLQRPHGALVTELEAGGPAQRAGLQAGDLIVRVNDEAVTQGSQLPRMVARNTPGTKLRLTYLRDGKERTAEVTLASLEPQEKQIQGDSDLPAGDKARSFGLRLTPNAGGGVRVLNVTGNLSGKLQPGDILLKANGQALTTPGQVTDALNRASKDNRPFLVQLKRGERTMFVAIDAQTN